MTDKIVNYTPDQTAQIVNDYKAGVAVVLGLGYTRASP